VAAHRRNDEGPALARLDRIGYAGQEIGQAANPATPGGDRDTVSGFDLLSHSEIDQLLPDIIPDILDVVCGQALPHARHTGQCLPRE
jgi:hypothetical protein